MELKMSNKPLPIYPEDDLKKLIKEAAKKDGRSMNNWIINLIKEKLKV